jgi:hypothetical protein
MSLIPLGFWAASGGGGGAPAFDLLETTTLTSSASSITFSGLSAYSDYKHLQIRAVVNSADAGTNLNPMSLQMNSDTGNNYSRHNLYGNGSSVASQGVSSSTNIYLNDVAPESNDNFGAIVMDILDYTSTTKYKTVRALLGGVDGQYNIGLWSGAWLSTSAVDTLTFSGTTFQTASRFSIYGIRG